AKEVTKEAHEAGIADRTLRRARAALGVVAQRVGERGARGGGYWTWELPDAGASMNKGANPSMVGPLGPLNQKSVNTPNTGAETIKAAKGSHVEALVSANSGHGRWGVGRGDDRGWGAAGTALAPVARG